MDGDIELLKRIYDRFNARDIDGVLDALADDTKAAAYSAQIEHGIEPRREVLLELELLLGLQSPQELQAQRLAVQVKHLRDRFQSATKIGRDAAAECLLAWCSKPGVAEIHDRDRCNRVFSTGTTCTCGI